MKIIDVKPEGNVRIAKNVLKGVDDTKVNQNSILQEKGNISSVSQSIPELQRVELTQKQFQSTTITYNENTVTYSDSSQVYGGIYGTDGELPVMNRILTNKSVIGKAKDRKPSTIRILDVENALRKIIDL